MNTTRPKTEVANLRKSATPRPILDHTKAMKAKDKGDKTQGKTTLISSSLGAGIGRRFKNRTRKTCSYVKRGATINRILFKISLMVALCSPPHGVSGEGFVLSGRPD